MKVFYDRFEETKLWGKDFYSYLSEIYQDRAMYTVVFISKAYAKKLWTSVERKAAQARAFSESREYLLPAVFDPNVEIPGILKTTGYVDLKDLAREVLAEKVIAKLQDDGVFLAKENASYAGDAKADVDFHLASARNIIEIIRQLKSHDWYVQRLAMEAIQSVSWAEVTADEGFVLGRNIYQCACGNERTAVAFLKDLRRQLAKILPDKAIDVLNGMFYEVYFDSKGEYRYDDIKSEHIADLFAIQTVDRYSDTITFIRRALSPYRDNLVVLPNTAPELISVRVKVARKDPPLIRTVECLEQQLLIDIPSESDDMFDKLWRLTLKKFTLETFRTSLAGAWYVPLPQLSLEVSPALEANVRLRLPKGKTVTRPSPSKMH